MSFYWNIHIWKNILFNIICKNFYCVLSASDNEGRRRKASECAGRCRKMPNDTGSCRMATNGNICLCRRPLFANLCPPYDVTCRKHLRNDFSLKLLWGCVVYYNANSQQNNWVPYFPTITILYISNLKSELIVRVETIIILENLPESRESSLNSIFSRFLWALLQYFFYLSLLT